MKVSSAMVTSYFNYLTNPNHNDFENVKIIHTLNLPVKGKLFQK